MRRRDFLALAGATATAWPLVVRAEQPALPVVGRISPNTPDGDSVQLSAYRRALTDAGFIDGKNVSIDLRYLNGNIDLALPTLTDLIRRRVSVLSFSGPSGSFNAANPFFTALFASGIPAVSGFARDPHVDGFIASLSHPDRNLTGVNQQTKELEPRRLNLLHDVAPTAKIIAYLARPGSYQTPGMIADLQVAASKLGLTLVVANADVVTEIDAAFAQLKTMPVDGLIIGADPFFNANRSQVLQHVAELRLPTIGEWKEYAEGGALLSYGTTLDALQYQIGAYTATILKGAKVADLPVVQLNVYDFAINLKTAKTLGLTVPASMQAIATEVIE